MRSLAYWLTGLKTDRITGTHRSPAATDTIDSPDHGRHMAALFFGHRLRISTSAGIRTVLSRPASVARAGFTVGPFGVC